MKRPGLETLLPTTGLLIALIPGDVASGTSQNDYGIDSSGIVSGYVVPNADLGFPVYGRRMLYADGSRQNPSSRLPRRMPIQPVGTYKIDKGAELPFLEED